MKTRRVRALRLLILVPCALVAGFLATLIVAVVCTTFQPGVATNLTVVENGMFSWSVIYQTGGGQSEAVMSLHNDAEIARATVERLKTVISRDSELKYDQAITVPDWCATLAREAESRLKPTILMGITGSTYCAGWPFTCLYGGTFFSSTLTSGTTKTNIGAQQFGRHLILTQPRPMPLFLDTLFYAAVLATLYELTAAWARNRRTLRRRLRGKCVACGYDRGGLADHVMCPECGASPAPPATQPSPHHSAHPSR